MSIVNDFWELMFQVVTNAVNFMETIYTNTTIRPFIDLFLVIVGLLVIMKYIIAPLIGFNWSGASDRADKNVPKDAWYKKVD